MKEIIAGEYIFSLYENGDIVCSRCGMNQRNFIGKDSAVQSLFDYTVELKDKYNTGENELELVDIALARRQALEDYPTRMEKIYACCNTARQVDETNNAAKDMGKTINHQQVGIIKLKEYVSNLIAENKQLKANHSDMVMRNKVLTQRPDIPIERTKVHEDIANLQQEVIELKTAIGVMGVKNDGVKSDLEKERDFLWERINVAINCVVEYNTSNNRKNGFDEECVNIFWNVICKVAGVEPWK